MRHLNDDGDDDNDDDDANYLAVLIEYSMRNIVLEKSYIICGREPIPSPFSKKTKLSISLDQYSKVLYILF